MLDVTKDPPNDFSDYESIDTDNVAVRYWSDSDGRPERLLIELGGVLRRHPVAYWAGSAFTL
jgi:hypothetical protein